MWDKTCQVNNREPERPVFVEYAVMLAILLLVVIGTIHLIGSNTNQMFSSVAWSPQCALHAQTGGWPLRFRPGF
jgi:hypothetical protein